MKNKRDNLRFREEEDRGLALIIVLWLMALITIIVTQFAFSMKVEVELTRNYKDQIIAHHLAIAGFHQSIMEIMEPTVEYSYTKEGQTGGTEFGHRKSEDETEETEKPPVNRNKIPLGQGSFSYRIIDEEGKLDLNWLGAAGRDGKRKKILYRFLETAAGIIDQEADEIIDSIFDWVDKDDNYRLNGAEDDYYQSLDTPYHCKNGPFDTIYDLQLVKGVTKEIFSKLEKDLTVWNVRGRYNRTSVSMTVLTAMAGDEEIAKEQWENMFDEDGKPVKKYRSKTYQIISTGYSSDRSTKRIIMAAVKTSGVGGDKPYYDILYWNDNYIPSEPE